MLAITYTLCGFGVTVGFHRLFTHRSFKTTRAVRALLAVLGSMAVEGPVIEWVPTHRKHHSFSDQPGDPTARTSIRRQVARLAARARACARRLDVPRQGHGQPGPLREGPARRPRPALHQPHLPALGGGRAGAPVRPGLRAHRDADGGFTGLLWGGAVRVFLLHHVTFSINSLCHFFGRRPFATGDESRNLAWLAPLAFGEAWHNNHHAFPTSARHGLGRRQLDPSAWLIAGAGALPPGLGRDPHQLRATGGQTGLHGDMTQVAPARVGGNAPGELASWMRGGAGIPPRGPL